MFISKKIRATAAKFASGRIGAEQAAELKDFFGTHRTDNFKCFGLNDAVVRAFDAFDTASKREQEWLKKWIIPILDKMEKEE